MENTIVFDLDTAVVELVVYGKEKLFDLIDKDLGKDFRESVTLEALGYTHLIYPGYYELFKWLHKRGDRIVFFSSGIKDRNVELIANLWNKVFGAEAEEVYQHTLIFSYEDCIDTNKMSEEEDEKYQPKDLFGRLKKKLEGLVVSKEKLPWTIMIEDDPHYIVKGEEDNFLTVPVGLGYYLGINELRFFRDFHKAFYVAGVLKKVFSLSAKKEISLTEALKEIQLSENEITDQRSRYYRCQENLSHYHEGLNLLRQVNSNIDFYFQPKSTGD